MMTEEFKLILAKMQIQNLVSLIEGNEYQQFLYSRLISIDVELQRQLTNIQYHSKLKE
jgi:predicted RNA-binding protein with EMAP domain